MKNVGILILVVLLNLSCQGEGGQQPPRSGAGEVNFKNDYRIVYAADQDLLQSAELQNVARVVAMTPDLGPVRFVFINGHSIKRDRFLISIYGQTRRAEGGIQYGKFLTICRSHGYTDVNNLSDYVLLDSWGTSDEKLRAQLPVEMTLAAHGHALSAAEIAGLIGAARQVLGDEPILQIVEEEGKYRVESGSVRGMLAGSGHGVVFRLAGGRFIRAGKVYSWVS